MHSSEASVSVHNISASMLGLISCKIECSCINCTHLTHLLVGKKITSHLSAKQCWGGMQMGKGYAGQANKAGNKAEAASICEEGFKQVESVYL